MTIVIIARSGRWLYADVVEKPVDIVGLPYDFWYEMAKADEQLERDENPRPLNEDGLLFYVRFRHAGETSTPTWPDSGAYETIDGAMRAAEATAPTTIRWG